uniref:efflux RND transporter permease subunit n=1 Tax=Escherichia coli TaxID=562 RepID=UPI0013D13301
VQRPLATVVIGGLVTATLLTLVVLPAVYSYLAHLRLPWRRRADDEPSGLGAKGGQRAGVDG